MLAERMVLKPPCERCEHIHAKKGNAPPCEECLPPLMPENTAIWMVYQHSFGIPEMIIPAMNEVGIVGKENRLRCMRNVVAAQNAAYLAEKQKRNQSQKV